MENGQPWNGQILFPLSSVQRQPFIPLEKSTMGPREEMVFPRTPVYFSSCLGGQDWLTQMPPFFKAYWPQIGREEKWEFLWGGPTGKVRGIFLQHLDCNNSSCCTQLSWWRDILTQSKTQPLNFRLKKKKWPSPQTFLSYFWASLAGVRMGNGVGVIRFCFANWWFYKVSRIWCQSDHLKIASFSSSPTLAPQCGSPLITLPSMLVLGPAWPPWGRHPFFWVSNSNSCSVCAHLTNRRKCAYVQLGLSHIAEKQR